MRPAVHRISDFERPALPLAFRLSNRLARPFAKYVDLSARSMMAEARVRTSLSDYAPDPIFEAGYDAWCRALATDPSLLPFGRVLMREMTIQTLSNRLLLEDLLERHPEILDEKIEAPIFIVGLPRTGTTHLHNLLAQDPDLRSLPYWESLEPIPPLEEQDRETEPDPRISRCDKGLRVQRWVLPLFPLMHEMAPEARHEEIQLLALSFSTLLFECMAHVPSYRDWYLSTDQRPAYRYLERTLKALQWLRGPKRWVLKSPQHLEHLDVLFDVFPDAKVIHTHRDPVRVTASLTTMLAYAHRMASDPLPARVIGGYWSDRVERMLRKGVRDRERLDERSFFDCRFHELLEDDLGMVDRVYDFLGKERSTTAKESMLRYVRSHTRGRLGTIDYRLEPFDLDSEERRRALRFYQERFDLRAAET